MFRTKLEVVAVWKANCFINNSSKVRSAHPTYSAVSSSKVRSAHPTYIVISSKVRSAHPT
jgi:hypothetical protein